MHTCSVCAERERGRERALKFNTHACRKHSARCVLYIYTYIYIYIYIYIHTDLHTYTHTYMRCLCRERERERAMKRVLNARGSLYTSTCIYKYSVCTCSAMRFVCKHMQIYIYIYIYIYISRSFIFELGTRPCGANIYVSKTCVV
jgi:hypothetical protein